MSRFVVLRHDSPRGLHWDFMLQMGEVLKTWALPGPPDSGGAEVADALPDHRVLYLDYEGPISDDRGAVTRWDSGTYRIEHQTTTELVVDLAGERLAGRAALRQVPEEPDRWRFVFAPESTGGNPRQ